MSLKLKKHYTEEDSLRLRGGTMPGWITGIIVALALLAIVYLVFGQGNTPTPVNPPATSSAPAA